MAKKGKSILVSLVIGFFLSIVHMVEAVNLYGPPPLTVDNFDAGIGPSWGKYVTGTGVIESTSNPREGGSGKSVRLKTTSSVGFARLEAWFGEGLIKGNINFSLYPETDSSPGQLELSTIADTQFKMRWHHTSKQLEVFDYGLPTPAWVTIVTSLNKNAWHPIVLGVNGDGNGDGTGRTVSVTVDGQLRGTFAFNVVNPQIYNMGEGFIERLRFFTIDNVATKFCLDTVSVSRSGGTSISGQVRDVNTSAPIAGATIRVRRGGSVTTDANGNYQISQVALEKLLPTYVGPGTGINVITRCWAKGYKGGVQRLGLAPGSQNTNINFSLTPSTTTVGQVAGRLFDRVTKSPVFGSTVTTKKGYPSTGDANEGTTPSESVETTSRGSTWGINAAVSSDANVGNRSLIYVGSNQNPAPDQRGFDCDVMLGGTVTTTNWNKIVFWVKATGWDANTHMYISVSNGTTTYDFGAHKINPYASNEGYPPERQLTTGEWTLISHNVSEFSGTLPTADRIRLSAYWLQAGQSVQIDGLHFETLPTTTAKTYGATYLARSVPATDTTAIVSVTVPNYYETVGPANVEFENTGECNLLLQPKQPPSTPPAPTVTVTTNDKITITFTNGTNVILKLGSGNKMLGFADVTVNSVALRDGTVYSGAPKMNRAGVPRQFGLDIEEQFPIEYDNCTYLSYEISYDRVIIHSQLTASGVQDTLDWILAPRNLTVEGKTYTGFAYGYKFDSPNNYASQIEDRMTWEVGGTCVGNTLVYGSTGGPNQEHDLIYADGSQPFWPSLVDNHITPLDYQKNDTSRRELVSFLETPSVTLCQPRKYTNSTTVNYLNIHCGGWSKSIGTPMRSVLFGTSSGIQEWTNLLDYVQKKHRDFYGIAAMEPLPMSDSGSYGGWNFGAGWVRGPGMFEAGDDQPSVPDPSYLTAPWSYEPQNNFAQLCNDMHDKNMKAVTWFGLLFANYSSLIDDHPTWIGREYYDGDFFPAYANASHIDLRTGIIDYAINKLTNARTLGLDGIWVDSYGQMANINYGASEPRPQYDQFCQLVAEMQQLGYTVFYGESFGGTFAVASGYPYVYQPSRQLSVPNETELYLTYRLSPLCDSGSGIYNPLSIDYYKYLAHKAPPIVVTAPLEGDTQKSRVYRANYDYSQVLSLMEKREVMLDANGNDSGKGVIWKNTADPSTDEVLWAFQAFQRSLTGGEVVEDVTTTRPIKSNISFDTLKVSACYPATGDTNEGATPSESVEITSRGSAWGINAAVSSDAKVGTRSLIYNGSNNNPQPDQRGFDCDVMIGGSVTTADWDRVVFWIKAIGWDTNTHMYIGVSDGTTTYGFGAHKINPNADKPYQQLITGEWTQIVHYASEFKGTLSTTDRIRLNAYWLQTGQSVQIDGLRFEKLDKSPSSGDINEGATPSESVEFTSRGSTYGINAAVSSDALVGNRSLIYNGSNNNPQPDQRGFDCDLMLGVTLNTSEWDRVVLWVKATGWDTNTHMYIGVSNGTTTYGFGANKVNPYAKNEGYPLERQLTAGEWRLISYDVSGFSGTLSTVDRIRLSAYWLQAGQSVQIDGLHFEKAIPDGWGINGQWHKLRYSTADFPGAITGVDRVRLNAYWLRQGHNVQIDGLCFEGYETAPSSGDANEGPQEAFQYTSRGVAWGINENVSPDAKIGTRSLIFRGSNNNPAPDQRGFDCDVMLGETVTTANWDAVSFWIKTTGWDSNTHIYINVSDGTNSYGFGVHKANPYASNSSFPPERHLTNGEWRLIKHNTSEFSGTLPTADRIRLNAYWLQAGQSVQIDGLRFEKLTRKFPSSGDLNEGGTPSESVEITSRGSTWGINAAVSSDAKVGTRSLMYQGSDQNPAPDQRGFDCDLMFASPINITEWDAITLWIKTTGWDTNTHMYIAIRDATNGQYFMTEPYHTYEIK